MNMQGIVITIFNHKGISLISIQILAFLQP